MTDEEKDFHKGRLAFVDYNGSLVYVINNENSHEGWMKGIYNVTDEEFDKLSRGYCNSVGDIVLYKTTKFLPLSDCEAVKLGAEAFNLAKNIYKTVKEFRVHNGVVIGEIGTVWEKGEMITIYYKGESDND